MLDLNSILIIITLGLVVMVFLFNFEIYRNILYIHSSTQTEPIQPATLRSFVGSKIN